MLETCPLPAGWAREIQRLQLRCPATKNDKVYVVFSALVLHTLINVAPEYIQASIAHKPKLPADLFHHILLTAKDWACVRSPFLIGAHSNTTPFED